MNKQAKQRVSELTAAQTAGVAREAKLAEAAAVAARAAELAAQREHIQKITAAAVAWDAALDGLVAATAAYELIDTDSPRVLPADDLRKLTSTRNSAMYILGYRLHSFIGAEHQPPFFKHELSRLVAHLPTAPEA